MKKILILFLSVITLALVVYMAIFTMYLNFEYIKFFSFILTPSIFLIFSIIYFFKKDVWKKFWKFILISVFISLSLLWVNNILDLISQKEACTTINNNKKCIGCDSYCENLYDTKWWQVSMSI